MSEHEQPDVVLTYCTDGATFHYQRPLSAGLPVGSYVTLEVPGARPISAR